MTTKKGSNTVITNAVGTNKSYNDTTNNGSMTVQGGSGQLSMENTTNDGAMTIGGLLILLI